MHYLFRENVDAIQLSGVSKPIPVVLEISRIVLLPDNKAEIHWGVLLPAEEGELGIGLTSGILPIELPPEPLDTLRQILKEKLPEYVALLEGKYDQKHALG